jgi:MFS family permease
VTATEERRAGSTEQRPAARASTPDRVRRLRRLALDLKPLRHVAYRRMFVGNAVAQFGLQFTAVAVQVQMYQETGSTAWVGLIGLAALVPLLIFAIWGGAVADVVDRRRLLLGSSLLMWFVTLGLLAQAWAHVGGPVLLLGLMAVQSMAFAISSPTRSAILPRLVPLDELAAANTLGSTAFNAAVVVGPLSVGLLLAHAPVAAAYAVDAVAFTAGLYATVRLPALPPATAGRRAGWRDVRNGLSYIMTSPVLLLSFAIDLAAMVLALPRALFPAEATRFGPAAIGWLYAAIGIGSVVAGLTSGWIGKVRRQGVALIVAVVAWGLSVAAAGLAGSLWLVVFFMALGGAADMISAVYRQTILQSYAPDELQGRMQGIFIAVVAGGPRLGDLRAGLTAALVGPTVAWVGGGVAAAVVALVLAFAYPALARYTPRGRVPAPASALGPAVAGDSVPSG